MQFVQKPVLLWQERFKAQNAPNCRNDPSNQLAYTKLQSFKNSNSVWYKYGFILIYYDTSVSFCRYSGYHGFCLNAEFAVYTAVLMPRM